ncbi:DUF441 domain-containing protein [Sporomusa acidovorans]|uniref:UPF0756 membrane protein SPACI_001220 n=1 Tax=Sporomusa acidovorans (strain ATCC 49682 / DSM 3132 / Mol) TaxID=1123286 RepID=A0ABZ3IWG8_SPOA4|nr:DUF441 domain-containing protein [Sporomusa acidovorans]OZC17981.1 hypothetical protein SPACI_36080 [Sporomusa acidovorans DSM 3132]SDF42028.1 Uncharacterized membrane protein, DUF441 family [Sporomusa acidovorans]
MNWDNLPLLLILVLSVIGNNNSVSIAVIILLLIKLLGFEAWFPFLESHGLNIGITILTIGILTPVAQGGISVKEMATAFKSSIGVISLAVGIFVSWAAGQGVSFMRDTPETVAAIIVGTIAGVCFLKGLAVGPLIAGGLVSLIISLLGKIHI